MYDELRTARIGLYSDQLHLVVGQRRQGSDFCLYRKGWEEDFCTREGQPDFEKLRGAVQQCRKLAERLFCEEVQLCGFGWLRYFPDSKKELEAVLGQQIGTVAGAQQARAAKKMLGDGCGLFGEDCSVQVIGREGQVSLPVGWRALWQREDGPVPDRIQEERMRQTVRSALQAAQVAQAQGDRLTAGGFDGVRRFSLLVCGLTQQGAAVLDLEAVEQLMALMRNPSLCWLGPVQKAQPVLPQKVFCQLVLLKEVLHFTGARQVALGEYWLEDALLGDANCQNGRAQAVRAGADL